MAQQPTPSPFGAKKFAIPYFNINEQPSLAKWVRETGSHNFAMGGGLNKSVLMRWSIYVVVGTAALKFGTDLMMSMLNETRPPTLTNEWKAAELEKAIARKDVDVYAPLRKHKMSDEVNFKDLNPPRLPFGQGSRS